MAASPQKRATIQQLRRLLTATTVHRSAAALTEALGRRPTTPEIAAAAGVSLSTVRRYLGADPPQRLLPPVAFGHWQAEMDRRVALGEPLLVAAVEAGLATLRWADEADPGAVEARAAQSLGVPGMEIQGWLVWFLDVQPLLVQYLAEQGGRDRPTVEEYAIASLLWGLTGSAVQAVRDGLPFTASFADAWNFLRLTLGASGAGLIESAPAARPVS